MANIAGKIWGTTELILANSSCEFHRIDYKAGGVCSKHKHEYKFNGFYIVSGKMKIKVWQKDYDLIDETILGPGDFTAVKPGLYHTFEGIEDGVAFELYWANFQHNDICYLSQLFPSLLRHPINHMSLNNVMY